MAFCSNCGHKLADGAKFCENCGVRVGGVASENEGGRRAFYEGEAHKCPQCGEVLNSFTGNCPSCGYELRGAKNSSSVKDLAEKIEIASSEEQRIRIIQNFPVPNTKEDICEFMILAASNFDAKDYTTNSGEKDVSEAWFSKIEQCYNKAKLLLNEADNKQIEEIYKNTRLNIKKVLYEKRKGYFFPIGLIIIAIIFMAIDTVEFFPIIGLTLLIVGIIRLPKNKRNQRTKK